jgi:hypothetical protein
MEYPIHSRESDGIYLGVDISPSTETEFSFHKKLANNLNYTGWKFYFR